MKDANERAIIFRRWLAAAVLILAGLWIYWPALSGDWLWDDDLLVTRNASLHSLDGLASFWTGTAGSDYWPLTSTLLWIEWHFFGADTTGYHLVALALHLAGGLLVWRLLHRLGLRWAWLGGLLFTVHPLAVESVAWISETKNTLSLPLFLLSLLMWLDHAEHGTKSRYWFSVLLFLAAMLAKSSVIMLPAVLLLLAWWQHGRITARNVTGLVPYLLIAAVLGFVTMQFQHHYGGVVPEPGGLLSRFALAGAVIFFYLGKFVMPTSLVPAYPAWPVDPPSWLHLLALPLLAVVIVILGRQRKDESRHALLGLGFFLLTLAPVMGFFPMAYHQIGWVADHLVYLPMIGLAGLVAGAFDLAIRHLSPKARPVILAIAALLAAWLTWTSHAYAGKFRDGDVLWTYTVAHNPDSPVARNNLGRVLREEGRLDDAEAQFREALRLRPGYALAHYNLGGVAQERGRMDAALSEFEQAVKDDPGFAEAHNNLGRAYQVGGRLDDAAREFRQALQINPGYALAHDNLGGVLQKQDLLDAAVDQYRLAVQADPDYVRGWFDLANALQLEKDYHGAIDAYGQVLELDPSHVEARNNLGCALLRINEPAAAIDQFRIVLQARPGDPTVQRNMERAEAMQATGTQ